MGKAKAAFSRARTLSALALAFGCLAACGGNATRDARDSTGGASPSAQGGSGASGQGAAGNQANGGGGANAASGGASPLTGGTSSSGASGAATAGSAGFELPIDGPTWKMRSMPFCAGVDLWSPSVAIWSSPQGVFAVVGSSVYQTAGAAWSELLSKPTVTFAGITGFLAGPLVLTAQSGSRCGILFLDGDALRCSGAAQNVSGVFAVDPTLAYAMANSRLLVYRGDFWTQVAELPDQTGVYGPKFWADRQNAIVTAAQGAVFRYELETDTTSALPPFSPNGEALAVWGFAPDDLWLASDSGELLHYDGTDWRPVFTESGACGHIAGMWGHAGVLYFYTPSTLYRMQGNRVEPILTLPCDEWRSQSVRSVWGNSPSEVFIAIQNYRLEQRVDAEGLVSTAPTLADPCGAIRVLYFDGERLGVL